jgi:hypothetical protein
MEAICAKILGEKVTRGFERLGDGGATAEDMGATAEAKPETKRKTSTKKKSGTAESGAEDEAKAAPADDAAVKPARRKKAG